MFQLSGDRPAQVLADDRVAGGFHDRGEPAGRLIAPLDRRDVGEREDRAGGLVIGRAVRKDARQVPTLTGAHFALHELEVHQRMLGVGDEASGYSRLQRISQSGRPMSVGEKLKSACADGVKR